MIVSTLASFLDNKKQDVASLAEFYPTMKFYDDKGKSKTDVMNKYFVMYQDDKPQATKDFLEYGD
jgi:microsomal prostaglandin-E synthase 2